MPELSQEDFDLLVLAAARELLPAPGEPMVPHPDIAAHITATDDQVEASLRRLQERGLLRFYAEGDDPLLRVYQVN